MEQYLQVIGENRTDDEKAITNALIRFFVHIEKIVYLDKDISSGSWLNSIYGANDTIFDYKINNPASYQGYDRAL